MVTDQVPDAAALPSDPEVTTFNSALASDAIPVSAAGSSRPASDEAPQASTAPMVDADRVFDQLARAQRLRLSKGDGGGLAGIGSGGGGTGLGLSTELSGRPVLGSPVVTPPVIVEGRPVECELPPTLHLAAVVHVLVTRDGSGAVPRVLESSGYAGFDRCALQYVLAMHFTPGLDRGARPLDVWMNVHVTPHGVNGVASPK